VGAAAVGGRMLEWLERGESHERGESRCAAQYSRAQRNTAEQSAAQRSATQRSAAEGILQRRCIQHDDSMVAAG